VQPHHAHGLARRLVERNEGHRARVVELGQPRQEGVAEMPDRGEEAKPEILGGDPAEKFPQHLFVFGPDRSHECRRPVVKRHVLLPFRKCTSLRLECKKITR
jgi:hypothetical protein